MLAAVLMVNALIALICFCAAWQIWRIRRKLAQVTKALTLYERSTHAVLNGAPTGIGMGQKGIYQLRQQYQQLEPQMQKLQRVLSLVSLGQTVWRRTMTKRLISRRRSKRF